MFRPRFLLTSRQALDISQERCEAFVEGANEPHYVENVGNEPTIVWVTVASAEGVPTTEFIDE